MSSEHMQNFVSRLKSKNFEIRKRAARDLNLYVTIIQFNIYLDFYLLFFIKVKTELREVSADERTIFNDDFNQHIFEMVSSSDSNEKIGGILAICKCLVNVNLFNIFLLKLIFFKLKSFKINLLVFTNLISIYLFI